MPRSSTLDLSAANLGQFVRDVDGPGSLSRIAEFLHEADVGHDYVLLEGDRDLTLWSVSVAKQSDRFIVICSAEPDHEERSRIGEHLDELTDVQRATSWIARLHPRGVDRPTRSERFLDDFGVGEVHNLRAAEAAHLARLGRLATGNGRGVVLGGGGAKRLAHIGALRALKEAGLDYDRIGGASIGAVVGAFAARDQSPEQMLAAATAELTSDILDFTLPLVALVKAEKMTKAIRNQFEGWDITDLWLPFYCVSTNLTTADLAVHRRGSVATAVRASTSIPVVLPPVPIDGELHVDGGVLDNVPVSPMVTDSSIGTVIAIDVSPAAGPRADEDFGLSVSGVEVLRRRISRRRTSPFPDIGMTLMSSMLIGSSRAKNESAKPAIAEWLAHSVSADS